MPRGRPKGSKNKATIELEKHVEQIASNEKEDTDGRKNLKEKGREIIRDKKELKKYQNKTLKKLTPEYLVEESQKYFDNMLKEELFFDNFVENKKDAQVIYRDFFYNLLNIVIENALYLSNSDASRWRFKKDTYNEIYQTAFDKLMQDDNKKKTIKEKLDIATKKVNIVETEDDKKKIKEDKELKEWMDKRIEEGRKIRKQRAEEFDKMSVEEYEKTLNENGK